MESVKKICEDEKLDFCPVEAGIEILSGKWKARILWKLHNKPAMRFGELRRSLGGITEKMLVQQLRELEGARLIDRKVYAEVPPKVEYSLSEFGETIRPILDTFAEWGLNQKERIGDIIADNRKKFTIVDRIPAI
ncbi:MAG: winged helix-turn-helix transcriptional regulator [Acidobacteria bacterium]|nr:winged helix-turn-helix transcriptional regulator [Acidobacteriota bacterium]